MNKVIKLAKDNWIVLLGTILGIMAGLFYWKLIGCTTGTCLISSSPIISSLWGGLIGGWLFKIVGDFKKHK